MKVKELEQEKVKVVEEHYDDIGEDLSGLGPDVKLFLSDFALEEPTDYSEETDDIIK